MAGIRIKDFAATAITVAADDYSAADSATLGTRKILCTVQATQYGTQLAANGMIFAAGSAAAPKLAIGTAGNGIYAPAVNALGITTAGVLRITVGASGLNGVGVTTPVTAWHVGTSLTTSPRGIMSAQYTTDALGARYHMRKARGTEAAPTIVVTGDDIGRLQWAGYDGAAYQEMASIRAAVTGTVAAGRVPTQLIFSTATDAATSVMTDRWQITPSGRLEGIGASTIATTTGNLTIAPPSGFDLEFKTGAAQSVKWRINNNGHLMAAITTQYINLGADQYLISGGTSTFDFRGISFGVATGIILAGQMGIATSSPGTYALAVNQATGQVQDWIYNDADGSPANHMSLVISSGGNATFAPSGGTLSVTGAFTASGLITASNGLTYALGKVMTVTSGTGQRAGDATLVNGTVTVTNTTVTANTRVYLTRKTAGGTIGMSVTYTLSAGTSFTITSDNALDTSIYSYLLVEVV